MQNKRPSSSLSIIVILEISKQTIKRIIAFHVLKSGAQGQFVADLKSLH